MANWEIVYKTKLGQGHKNVTAKTESDAKILVKKDKMVTSIVSCKEIITTKKPSSQKKK